MNGGPSLRRRPLRSEAERPKSAAEGGALKDGPTQRSDSKNSKAERVRHISTLLTGGQRLSIFCSPSFHLE